jgi:glycosyltransferase involved in cell wall biosynthesis
MARRLAQRYTVHQYDWDEIRRICPGDDDVLIGHPHPAPWTCFRWSATQSGWRRVLMLSPYNHGDPWQVPFLDSVLPYCDQYLAITGRYWFDSVIESPYAHWRPKMVHMDLAVDREKFPVIKRQFNAPGSRCFVYIGHSGWTKNTPYLSAIAKVAPDCPVSWIGRGDQPIANVEPLGFQNFATDEGKRAVAKHDFLLTVGRADANPTTILEAMAWGLIPVCTPQSGYVDYPSIFNVPLDDPEGAAAVLRRLQNLPETELAELQIQNWQLLDDHFNWDRFAGQVISAVESDESPLLGGTTDRQRRALQSLALHSPLAYWRPRNLVRLLWHNVRSRLLEAKP